MTDTPETQVIRTLAAIVMADVANYSQLMATDEVQTVQTLQSYRQVFVDQVESGSGKVLDAKGDAIMAAFNSAVDAVSTSVRIQKEIAKQNEALPENRRMRFRIGVNLGDVVKADDTMYGDGVNIAGRLEATAKPGGVCISRSIHDQVLGKLPLQFEDLGEQQVKTERFHAYRITSEKGQPGSGREVAGQPHGNDGAGSAEPARPAIVVLPFTNMSGDPEQEYFADGITEELTTHLSRFKQLTVIARNSAFQYKGKAVDVRQVGKQLGARFVLEGSVRKAGNRLRVTAQLLDARDGTQIWAETYDRELTTDAIFDVQDDLTSRIVGILADTFGVISQSRLEESRKRSTSSMDAYEWVLRAQSNYRNFSINAHRQVQEGLEQAVRIDPNYAEAWAWLAATYRDEFIHGYNLKPDSLGRADRAARQALDLDPGNAEANLVLSQVFFFHGELDKFKRYAERTLNENPDNADVCSAIAIYLSFSGEIERAEKIALRAIELNPHVPGYAHQPRFYAQYLAENYDEACAILESTAQATYLMTYVNLAAVYGQLGRTDEARTSIDRAREMRADINLVDRLTIIWLDPTLRNAMFDGLRKAGLDMPD